MLETVTADKAIVTSPHFEASRAGLEVLKKGGNASEAAVAVAACLAVVYPHMTGIGGDSFWLLRNANGKVTAVNACGRSGSNVSADLYRDAGYDAIPWRGGMAANTVAGTISGWDAVLKLLPSELELEDVLSAAIGFAEKGVEVLSGFEATARQKDSELKDVIGFGDVFRPSDRSLIAGDILKQPALGETLKSLAKNGLLSFYKGELAKSIASDLAQAGSPLTLEDLNAHRVHVLDPLRAKISHANLYNAPPPTQGLSSLVILSLFDQMTVFEADGFDHIHSLVEATKQAFALARRVDLGDPEFMKTAAQDILDDDEKLKSLASKIDSQQAADFNLMTDAGDTTWFSVMDSDGNTVSAIQSIYHEFGSGVVLPESGITWQNRGASFSLDESSWNCLKPNRLPFHTLNPAIAELDDGRVMAYGTMGGEGQPQTQAAVFTRYAKFDQDLQNAINAPRWLFGKTWGEESSSLKLEGRFDPSLINSLKSAGHDVEVLEDFSQSMGHAGALVRHPDGRLEGATDPRSDGEVAAW